MKPCTAVVILVVSVNFTHFAESRSIAIVGQWDTKPSRKNTPKIEPPKSFVPVDNHVKDGPNGVPIPQFDNKNTKVPLNQLEMSKKHQQSKEPVNQKPIQNAKTNNPKRTNGKTPVDSKSKMKHQQLKPRDIPVNQLSGTSISTASNTATVVLQQSGKKSPVIRPQSGEEAPVSRKADNVVNVLGNKTPNSKNENVKKVGPTVSSPDVVKEIKTPTVAATSSLSESNFDTKAPKQISKTDWKAQQQWVQYAGRIKKKKTGPTTTTQAPKPTLDHNVVYASEYEKWLQQEFTKAWNEGVQNSMKTTSNVEPNQKANRQKDNSQNHNDKAHEKTSGNAAENAKESNGQQQDNEQNGNGNGHGTKNDNGHKKSNLFYDYPAFYDWWNYDYHTEPLEFDFGFK